MDEGLLLSLAAILFVGMAAQWIAWRLRLPSILLLLVFGFLVGPLSIYLTPSGEKLVDPDRIFGDLLFPLVSLFVGVILFEGGLSLSLRELREVGRVVRNFMSIGVIATWLMSGAAAWWFLGLSLGLSMLFGAILTVTGPTVIGPLLRHVRPTGRVDSILKWEGIVNDPIGAMLSVLVFEAIVQDYETTPVFVFLGIVKTLGVGIVFGWVGAAILIQMMKRYLIPDFLHSAVALATAVAVFGVANTVVHESGLLAVTVMGMTLANQKSVNIDHIAEFKENLSILFISILFILLSARLQIEDLSYVSSMTMGFLAVLIFLIRPLSVFFSTLGAKLTTKEKIFLGWMAPRGVVAAAVASVFALRLGLDGDQDAQRMVPLMFIVIIGTVSVYGLTAAPLARRLGLSHPNPQGMIIIGAHEWARKIALAIKDAGFHVLLVDTNWEHTTAARMEGLPCLFGSALSEYAVDQMDLDGIGRLLAMTPNDEVNSLSALHFSEMFGRSGVYQLSPASSTPRRQSSFRRARELFGPGATFDDLNDKFEHGYTVKTTGLTDEFGGEDFDALYPEGSVPLFIKSDSKLHIYSKDSKVELKSGMSIIAIVPDAESAS